MTYFDTSVLVPLYVSEPGTSGSAARLMAASEAPVFLTAFHLHELRTVLRGLKFQARITAPQMEAAFGDLQLDLEMGIYQLIEVDWPQVFAIAEHISEAFAAVLGVRAADILHVASAQYMGAQASDFVTFDKRQQALAQLALER